MENRCQVRSKQIVESRQKGIFLDDVPTWSSVVPLIARFQYAILEDFDVRAQNPIFASQMTEDEGPWYPSDDDIFCRRATCGYNNNTGRLLRDADDSRN